jgi:hypothetical protein
MGLELLRLKFGDDELFLQLQRSSPAKTSTNIVNLGMRSFARRMWSFACFSIAVLRSRVAPQPKCDQKKASISSLCGCSYASFGLLSIMGLLGCHCTFTIVLETERIWIPRSSGHDAEYPGDSSSCFCSQDGLPPLVDERCCHSPLERFILPFIICKKDVILSILLPITSVRDRVSPIFSNISSFSQAVSQSDIGTLFRIVFILSLQQQ